jgi:hypothetical protein
MKTLTEYVTQGMIMILVILGIIFLSTAVGIALIVWSVIK